MSEVQTEENTQDQAVELTGRLEKFNFKVVKASESKYPEVKAAMDAGKIAYTPTLVAGQVVSITRDAFEVELPIVSVVDLATHNPAFVQELVDKLVSASAKKLFIDKYQDVGELTLDMIIAANTPAPRSSVPAELLVAFSGFVAEVMTEKQVKAGTMSTVLDMIKGKFNTNVLNKYAKMSEMFPQIMEKILGYVEDHADEQAQLAFVPVCELLASNLERFLAAEATADDELDLDVM